MKKLIAIALLAVLPVLAHAEGEGPGWGEPANNNVSNTASLQRGAKYFVNYCMGCHSLKFVRYNSLIDDLGLTQDQLEKYLMFSSDSIYNMMTNSMRADDAEHWFGKAPPDLSLEARARGTDWIYNYLRSFYLDPKQATGVNNLYLKNAAMPDVLAPLQGYQKAVFRTEESEDGSKSKVFDHFEMVKQGRMSPEEYDQAVRDIVNFLDYVGEPVQLKRKQVGYGVIAFLLVFFLFAFFLKREYWKDVH